MQFSSRQFANVAVAEVAGRIDHAGAAAFEQSLSPLLARSGTGKGSVVLDFGGVEYISSVGLRVLMIAAKEMKGHGARIILAAPQAGGRRDPRDQPLRPRPRNGADGAPRAGVAVRIGAGRLRRGRGLGRDAVKGIRFWGTRGSLPATLTAEAVRQKIVAALAGASGRVFATRRDLNEYVDGLGFAVSGTYGGHTSCVELVTRGSEYVLCDLAAACSRSGRRRSRATERVAADVPHLRVHMHWDHIMGLPFFKPAYLPATACVSTAATPGSRRRCAGSRTPRRFPPTFGAAGGHRVHVPGAGPALRHRRHGGDRDAPAPPGDSFGFRFESDGRSVVYTTDSEHRLEDPAQTAAFVEFFRDATS